MLEMWFALAIFVGLLALLAMGVWVAVALLLIGLVSLLVFSNAPAGIFLATTTWGTMNSWSLAALPLFIWMGEILFRSRLSST